MTWTEQLLEKLQILNPELEYCAIVVDEVKPAKKICAQVGLPKNLIYPLYELKECVNNFYYDYIICIEDGWWEKNLFQQAKKYGAQENKLLLFNALTSATNFLVEHSLRYFRKHSAEFEMFATGISLTAVGLDVSQFTRKIFNFGRTGEDLYYNFQVAKFVISCARETNHLHYALIALPAYAFQYDQTKTFNNQFLMLQYLIAFEDLHNFFVPVDVYKKFFNENYLITRLAFKNFDTNNPYFEKVPMTFINRKERLNFRGKIDTWAERNFPKTLAENVKILDDYLTLCEENNIRPIMFLMPATEGYIKHYNRQRIDEFHYCIQKNLRNHPNAVFIDGWNLQGLNESDFYDAYHLNIRGAAKFSAFLNDFIESL